MAENKTFLNFIDRLEQNPENFRITKSQSFKIKICDIIINDIRRTIKRIDQRFIDTID